MSRVISKKDFSSPLIANKNGRSGKQLFKVITWSFECENIVLGPYIRERKMVENPNGDRKQIARTANSFLRRTKRMEERREGERNKWRKWREKREREKREEERNETEWTELLKISVAWKTVLEVGTSDLLPRMYNWSNFLKSYRSFKYNRVREISRRWKRMPENCDRKQKEIKK